MTVTARRDLASHDASMDEQQSRALIAISIVLESFGRALVCLDRQFHIVHVSDLLRRLAGRTEIEALLGKPAHTLLGEELFAAGGAMQRLLENGERREGWRASIRCADGPARVMSFSAAPLLHDRFGIYDPRVAYVVLLRPADEDDGIGTGAPIVFSGMIARSTAMSHLFQIVQNLQASEATILLTGESGTGKEVLARAIHAHSPRKDGRFVAVNIAAMPAELFAGRIDLAAGGTLFLDEIGDMPLPLQAQVLRFLQDQTFDTRITAATRIDLRKVIAEGRFRQDLYERLRAVPLEIPPLRERREDIEPLAQYLLNRVADRHGRAMRFSPDAIRALLRYSWPGNVRELENAIEYAIAVGRGPTIQPEDLPVEVTEATAAPRPQHAPMSEHDRLRIVLDAHQWRRDDAARALGISRTTLWRRMRELGLI